MSIVNEQIVTGRKFRKLIDEATKLWQRISFWTKASDVEFDDGSDAETKLGAINGITDSLTSTASNIAASAAAVKALNDKVIELSSDLAKKIKLLYLGTIDNPYNGTHTATFTDDLLEKANIIGCQLVQLGHNVTTEVDPDEHPYALKYDGNKWTKLLTNRTTFDGLVHVGNAVDITYTNEDTYGYGNYPIHFFVAYI